MSRRHRASIGPRIACAALLGGLVGSFSADASAITRDEVIARAKAFSFHPWRFTAQNATASCSGSYQSAYLPGDYMGLPYDWGGYMTLFEFNQQIAAGYGAGSYPEHGVLECTSGLDCSGFVSKAWNAGHYATATVHQTSSVVAAAQMLPGDIFNEAGFHMAMYSHVLGNGDPVFYEAVGYNVHISQPGWAWVDGFIPRRFSGITGNAAGDPVGTITNPIPVNSFPFTDLRNTTASLSDMLDGCGAAPNTKETGPEYVYAVTVTKPGTLTAVVQDDVGVDIDVHLYTSANTGDCVARADAAISHAVDCGTYYVVADTFRGAQEFPGAYELVIEHTPSGAACGNGPPKYDFAGALAEPCAFPGNENLPFCNPNLGAQTCIYGGDSSFCSAPCASNADCGAFAGGCCAELGSGELYCMEASFCGGGDPGGESEDPPPPAGDPGTSGSGTGGTGATTVGAGAGLPATAGAGGATGNPADPGDDDDDTVTVTRSACAAAPAPTGTSGYPAWLAAFGLALFAIRRRRTG